MPVSDDLDNESDDETTEELRDFFLTNLEAIANYAFGDDLITVRLDDQDVKKGYVKLHSSPENEIEFDYLNYYLRAESLFSEEKQIEIFLQLAKFYERDGHIGG